LAFLPESNLRTLDTDKKKGGFMISTKTILCPVDFFPASDRAVDYAASLAAHYGAKIRLLHVVTSGKVAVYEYPLNIPALTKSMEEGSRSEMKTLAEKVKRKGVAVEIEVRMGDVCDTIERQIFLEKPHLVVMGTHGRRVISWFLGSVTASIMRHSPVPVLTMSSNERIHEPAFRRILVATDFGDGTAEAVDYAFSIAQENDSEITMLHVVRDLKMELLIEERRSLIEVARKGLENLVPPDAGNWCEVSTRVEEGLPHRIILQTLETMEPDLLVMSIHGKTMFERAFHVNTAERVVRVASCPVMLIPSMKRKASERSTAYTADWSSVA
jgi:nucleotide-binding universal stress UspA family protein